MTKTNQMKCDIRDALNTILPSYPYEAPVEQAYPYIEFEWDIIARPGEGVSRGTIDVHVWDNTDGYGVCDETLDQVEALFDGYVFGDDLKIYSIRGTRSHRKDNAYCDIVRPRFYYT